MPGVRLSLISLLPLVTRLLGLGQQQRGTGLAYFTAFFRTYIGREPRFFPLLTGDTPPPPSAMTNNLHVSYHPSDDPLVRRDVNRLLKATNLTTNTLGGAVTQVGLTPYDLCGGKAPQPQHCLPTPPQPTSRQPHTTPSRASLRRGLSQLQLGWDAPTASYQNELPVEARDVSGYFALQFRASVDFLDTRNEEGVAQDFSVTLTDGTGEAATAVVSHLSRALFFPPGRIPPIGQGQRLLPVPKIFHNTVRIPLEVFRGIDLANVESIRFDFDQRSSGALFISDLLFADVRQLRIQNGKLQTPLKASQ